MPKVTIDEEIVKTRIFKVELTEDEVNELAVLSEDGYKGALIPANLRDALNSSTDWLLRDAQGQHYKDRTNRLYKFWHDVSRELAVSL